MFTRSGHVLQYGGGNAGVSKDSGGLLLRRIRARYILPATKKVPVQAESELDDDGMQTRGLRHGRYRRELQGSLLLMSKRRLSSIEGSVLK